MPYTTLFRSVSVQPRSSEIDRGLLEATKIAPYLPQPEQIEVVNQECADQQQQPAEEVQRVDRPSTRRTFDAPDHAAHRPPLPKQQQQRETGKENVCATFCRFGHDASPGAFEPLPRHQAVL